jgi:hypothetical protein
MTHNVKKIWSFRQLSSIAVTLRPVFIYVTSDMCNNLSPKHHHNMMGSQHYFLCDPVYSFDRYDRNELVAEKPYTQRVRQYT